MNQATRSEVTRASPSQARQAAQAGGLTTWEGTVPRIINVHSACPGVHRRLQAPNTRSRRHRQTLIQQRALAAVCATKANTIR